MWAMLASAGLVVVSGDGCVQAQAASGSVFEVASIRLHHGDDDHQETNLLPGGRYVGINASVRKLIRLAFGIEDNQILGVPGWIDKERYDIDAKTESTATLEPPEFQQALGKLLEDRFQFQFHREMRERNMYSLVVPKGGAKLTEHKGNLGQSISTNAMGTKKVLEATQITMKDLAALLSRQTGKVVEDHTGLLQAFDVKLEWDDNQAADAEFPSVFSALQEQLGLKLKAAKGKVGVIVVDRVERPSEN